MSQTRKETPPYCLNYLPLVKCNSNFEPLPGRLIFGIQVVFEAQNTSVTGEVTLESLITVIVPVVDTCAAVRLKNS